MSLPSGLLDIDVPVSLEPIYNEHSDRSCLCTPLSVCVSGGKTQLAERLLLCGEPLPSQSSPPTPLRCYAITVLTIILPCLAQVRLTWIGR